MQGTAIRGMLLALCVFLPATAGAEIYQCEESGRKVFSQQPCGSNAKKVEALGGERSVKVAVDMPGSDIRYLCSLAIRAWEKSAVDRRNQGRGGYARDSEDRRRAFVLSHVSNLESVAVNDPELFDIIKRISQRSYYGNPGDYAYDAERARAQQACAEDVVTSINKVNARRVREAQAAGR